MSSKSPSAPPPVDDSLRRPTESSTRNPQLLATEVVSDGERHIENLARRGVVVVLDDRLGRYGIGVEDRKPDNRARVAGCRRSDHRHGSGAVRDAVSLAIRAYALV